MIISRWKLSVLILLPLLGLAAFWWWRGQAVPVATVVRRDWVQTVVASGHVETPHRVEISAQLVGKVKRVALAEGQSVQAGEILLELDDAELQANLNQARAMLAQAENHVRQMREVQGPVSEQTLRQAQATLETARTTQQRNMELFRQHFIGEAALQESRRALAVTEAQVAALDKQLASNRPGGSDFAMAEDALAAARATLAASEARLTYARISAPAAGTVLARNVEVGDVVQPGKALLTLSPNGLTQLVLQIDEKNLRLLSLGQAALASTEAAPDQRFPALLSYISPAVNPQTGALEVKLDVKQAPPLLRQDMTVSVDIEVGRKNGALLLPFDTVRDADKNPWVLRVENGVARRVPVKIGPNSAGWAEALAGVAAGDSLIPAQYKVKPGSHVRTRTQ
jgi:HlyD family secretion protein